MTDAAFILKSDAREKKRNGRGYCSRNRSGKGAMKTPSDYLSAKEIKKLSGEVVGIKMNKPIDYNSFKKMSADMQKEYLMELERKFCPSREAVANMMGCSVFTISKIYCSFDMKREFGRNDGVFKRKEWNEWIKESENALKTAEKPKETTKKPKDVIATEVEVSIEKMILSLREKGIHGKIHFELEV